MPTPVVAPRLRVAGIVAGILVALVLLLLSHGFGRAVPTNNYRPLLTTDAIATGCFPLPGGARLDLAYQVRRDGDVGERRRLEGQYDLVDRDEAQRRLVSSFTAVGFRAAGTEGGAEDGAVVLTKGSERVTITVTALPGTSADTLVRGTFVLDLPVVAVSRPDDPLCHDPKSTKRWGKQ